MAILLSFQLWIATEKSLLVFRARLAVVPRREGQVLHRS